MEINTKSNTSSIKIKINLRNTTLRSHKDTKTKILRLTMIYAKKPKQVQALAINKKMLIAKKSHRIASESISYDETMKANEKKNFTLNLARIC